MELEFVSPEGEVPDVSELTIRFSEPVVALGPNPAPAGILLQPEHPGNWHWVDLQTLVYTPESPFPGATAFTLTIPAEVTLSDPAVVHFATRWPRVRRVEPLGDNLPLQPLFKIVFDAPIEPETALHWIHLEGDLPLELAPETPERHERVLVVRPVHPLTRDTPYTLRVQGISEARSPGKPNDYPFRTYGPLHLQENQTSPRSTQDVLQWRSLSFNNPLVADGVRVELQRHGEPFTPAPTKVSGQELLIGALGGPYRCRILSLRDVYGQALPEPLEMNLDFPSPSPLLSGQRNITVVDPRRPIYRVHVQNLPNFRYEVVAGRWGSGGNLQGIDGPYPGPVLQKGTASDAQLDLSPAVRKGAGQLVLHLWRGDKLQVRCWIQVARLNLSLFSDPTQTSALVTDDRGRPVAGALVGSEKTDQEGIARCTATDTVIATFQGQEVFVPTPTVARRQASTHRWLLYADRPSYRPGERVALKGWLRNCPPAGAALLPPDCPTIEYTLYDRNRQQISTGTLALSSEGGFDLELQLPETLLLGKATLVCQTADRRAGEAPGMIEIHVAHERRVYAETTLQGECRVSLRHFTGEPVPNARVSLRANLQARRETLDGFHFGPDTHVEVEALQAEGVTDAQGIYQVDLAMPTTGFAYDVHWKVHSQDLALHSWHHEERTVWHPAALRVGLRCLRMMVPQGQSVDVDLTVLDHEGRPVPGRAWEIEADPPLRGVSAELPVRVRVALKHPGANVIRARIRDDRGKESISEVMTWALDRVGPLAWLGPRRYRPEQLRLMLAETPRQVGERGKLLVVSPLFPAQGVLRLVCGGILLLQPFTVTRAQTLVEWGAPAGCVGPVQLLVTVVGANSLAEGELALHFDTTAHTLDVHVSADGTFEPGGTVQVAISVRDGGGAEVALFGIDAAALAAYPDTLPDPVGHMYGGRESTAASRSTLELLGTAELSPSDLSNFEHPWRRDEMRCQSSLVAPAPEPVEPRCNFAPRACFFPRLVTDAKGHASAEFTLPDNLTRYRLVAIAVQGDKFGRGETALIVSRPATLRPNAPTVLRPADEPLLGVAVGEDELSLPLHGPHVQIASSGDAMEFSIQMAAYHPPEVFGTSGFLCNERREFTVHPHGELEVVLDSAESLGWLDAITRVHAARATNGEGTVHDYCIQLLAEPFRDALPVNSLLRIPANAWKRTLSGVLDRARDDGGFGFQPWKGPGPQRSSPYRTVLMLHTALEASLAGANVHVHPLVEWVQRNVLDQDASRLATTYEFQRQAAQEALRNAQAYAWFVWKHYDLGPLPELPAWIDEELPPETLGWLLRATGHPRLLSRLLSLAYHTAGEMVVQEKDRSMPASSDSMLPLFGRRGQALLLMYLLESTPDHPHVVKLLHGLFAHQFQEHWSHVFDPTHTTVALLKYCRRFEPRLPEFQVQTSVTAEPLHFEGTGQTRRKLLVPAKTPLDLEHSGTGRLYYHVRWRDPAAPARLDQHGRGLSLTRTYTGPTLHPDGFLVAGGGSVVCVTLRLMVPRLSALVQVVEPRIPGLEVESGTPPKGFEAFSVFDDRLEWSAPFLERGVYSLTYEARLTCRGTFGIPPAYARKTYEPEVYGQTRAERIRVT